MYLLVHVYMLVIRFSVSSVYISIQGCFVFADTYIAILGPGNYMSVHERVDQNELTLRTANPLFHHQPSTADSSLSPVSISYCTVIPCLLLLAIVHLAVVSCVCYNCIMHSTAIGWLDISSGKE